MTSAGITRGVELPTGSRCDNNYLVFLVDVPFAPVLSLVALRAHYWCWKFVEGVIRGRDKGRGSSLVLVASRLDPRTILSSWHFI